jgi:DNA-binding NarL/FixJ family response regulator
LLGRREADVAGLVAEGLSNKQIGAKLFISERTVDSHVRNILNKLGFNSRAQIAGWIASLRP